MNKKTSALLIAAGAGLAAYIILKRSRDTSADKGKSSAEGKLTQSPYVTAPEYYDRVNQQHKAPYMPQVKMDWSHPDAWMFTGRN